MRVWIIRQTLLVLTVFLTVCIHCHASEARPTAQDPELEARVQQITSNLRCLVCQNQSIADSHSGLATDLRRQVREMLQQGKSEAEIQEYMTHRYGDFVLYSPPFKTTTIVLWVGPGVILLGGLAFFLSHLIRRRRAPAEGFDPEPPSDQPPH